MLLEKKDLKLLSLFVFSLEEDNRLCGLYIIKFTDRMKRKMIEHVSKRMITF